MTPRYRFLFVGVALVLSATGCWFAWKNRQRADQARMAVHALVDQKTAALPRIDLLQKELAAAEKERNDLQSELQHATKPSDPIAPKTPPVAVVPPKNISPLERLKTDPDLQRLKLAADRARFSSGYGPFFRASGLNEAEIERFKDVMIRRDGDLMDLAALKSSRATTEDQAVADKLREKTYTEYFSAMRELLGPARYQQFEEFEHVAPVREIVSGMASAAVGAGTPFTAEQADQMVNVLAESAKGRSPNGFVFPAVVDWASAFKRAESILSPSQLEIIKTVEPRGPRGAGSRYLIELHKAIDAAEEAERSPVKE